MQIRELLYFFLIVFLLTGCDEGFLDPPKIQCDCAPSGYWQFDLVTRGNSQNSLVFGPNAIYLPNEITVYAPNDSTFYDLTQSQPGAISGNHFVTILDNTPETITISADSLSQFDAKVEYTDLNIECCPGAITEITFRDSVYKHDQGVFRLVFD